MIDLVSNRLLIDFKSKHHLYLLRYRDSFVTSVALTEVEGGFNCWGLATVSEFQQMGFAKEIYHLLAMKLNKPLTFFAQNNVGSKFDIFRKSKKRMLE